MAETPDLRTESDRRPGAFTPPAIGNGEVRNLYRRADGSLRYGPAWRDYQAAFLACDPQPGETFVEARDTRWETIDASAMGVTKPEPGTADKRALARAQGYTGDACTGCGNFALRRAGTCLCCDACGQTTGCS